MKKIIITILGLAILSAGWYLLSPIFIDVVVDEEVPAIVDTPQLEIIDEPVVFPPDIILDYDVVMDEPMMENPESFMLKKGAFTGADNFHKGRGDLLVISDSEKTFLRFENFSVSNGPDLYVTLNKGADANSEHLILERLKGNKGPQNYDISHVDLLEYESVSIYCRAFSTVFASAPLSI